MCLAVPGKVLSIADEGDALRMAKVSFSGVVREVSLAFTPEAGVDSYVIVHAGSAIGVLDEAEARKTIEELRRIDPSLVLGDEAP